jgi:hypothetical protein
MRKRMEEGGSDKKGERGESFKSASPMLTYLLMIYSAFSEVSMTVFAEETQSGDVEVKVLRRGLGDGRWEMGGGWCWGVTGFNCTKAMPETLACKRSNAPSLKPRLFHTTKGGSGVSSFAFTSFPLRTLLFINVARYLTLLELGDVTVHLRQSQQHTMPRYTMRDFFESFQ